MQVLLLVENSGQVTVLCYAQNMKFQIFIVGLAFNLLIGVAVVHAKSPTRYSQLLCESGKYRCLTVSKGQSWARLFPDTEQRQVVMRLNRMNTGLHSGMKIAVPQDIANTTIADIAPFSKTYDTAGQKLILVDLSLLAWGAYDENGTLLRWGPASGGRGYCPDIPGPCKTATGDFTLLYKQGVKCKSKTYPLPDGGAPMPYCLFYKGGYAIHGSNEVPGYHASHGCVRTYTQDVKWLNEEFAGRDKVRIVVLPETKPRLP